MGNIQHAAPAARLHQTTRCEAHIGDPSVQETKHRNPISSRPYKPHLHIPCGTPPRSQPLSQIPSLAAYASKNPTAIVAPISPSPPPRSIPYYISNYPNPERRQKLSPGERRKKLLFHTSRKALIFFSPPSPPSSFLIAAARQIASRTNILVYSRTTFNAGWDILVFLSSKFSVKRRWMSWVESGCCSSVGISGGFRKSG